MEDKKKRVRICKEPYTCIRCGYKTSQKRDMRKHFTLLKKKCPAIVNNIELTDEIKNFIIDNRIYHMPKETKPPTFIQNIQQNNIMMNYISKLNTRTKLDKYLEFRDEEIVSLEDNVQSHFGRRIRNLKTDAFKFGYDMGNNRLFDIFEEITKIRNLQDMNIIYDDKLKELSLFKSGCWETMLIERGIKEILSMLKEYFLDHYELFLFRRIYIIEKNEREKQKYKVHLEEYYKFIGTYDLRPIIEDKDDADILGEENGEVGVYKLEEKWMKIYKTLVDNMKRYEINKIKKDIDLIVKNNSNKNLNELNKALFNLLTTDEEFKELLEETINPNKLKDEI
jgi:hypothetical protein